MDNAVPVIFVTPQFVADGVISLVGKCPFCKRLHYHGGGRDAAHIVFGYRLSHCLKNPMEYKLVPDVRV